MPSAAAPSPPGHAELAAKVRALPALPSVACELLAGAELEALDIGRLARQIAADQALAARTLRIANSSFYGLQGQVVSIHEAIVVLGFRAIRSLVIAAAAVSTLSALVPERQFPRRAFWRHSVGSAVAARQLALLARRNPESAFAAGLLHDIGRLVLAVCFPQHFVAVLARLRSQGEPLPLVEEAVFGLTHAEAGALLAAQWGLPDALVEAIALHHEPEAAGADSLANLAHVANVLAHGLEIAGVEDEPMPTLSDLAWARLGIDWGKMRLALARIESEFDDILHALIH